MDPRLIIEIDESRCDGCGACIPGCHEGALAIVDGKARLVSDVYCDGLGDCLGHCPRGALRVVRRHAEAFDQEAVRRRLRDTERAACAAGAERPVGGGAPASGAGRAAHSGGCPGSMARTLRPDGSPGQRADGAPDAPAYPSALGNWPVQWRLIPPTAPYLAGAKWLLAADCTAFAHPAFPRLSAGRVVVVGCPKLDDAQAFTDKLAAMLQAGPPSELAIVRMEVPCCGGLERIAAAAMERAGVRVPVEGVIVGLDGASPPLP